VVLRPGRTGPQILVVHRPRYDDWTLPKGKDEPGETAEASALREVWEETGFRCRLIRPVGTSNYMTSTGEDKVVRYFAMRPVSGRFRRNGEVDALRWLSRQDALVALTYERDRRLLAELDLDGLLTTSTLYLVRHGAAGRRSTWESDDELRPLSNKGLRQAKGLVRLLEGEFISALLTSPHLRCRQTIEPLAAARRIAIQEADELAEGAGGKPIHQLAETLVGTNAVLCSHGDVIPELLDRLVRRGLDLQTPFDCQKGSVWIVEIESGEFTRARYLAPVEG